MYNERFYDGEDIFFNYDLLLESSSVDEICEVDMSDPEVRMSIAKLADRFLETRYSVGITPDGKGYYAITYLEGENNKKHRIEIAVGAPTAEGFRVYHIQVNRIYLVFDHFFVSHIHGMEETFGFFKLIRRIATKGEELRRMYRKANENTLKYEHARALEVLKAI